MPINYETETGYYDGIGMFHPNTGLLPTIIPGISITTPINPNQGYDILPDIQPYVPYQYTPEYHVQKAQNQIASSVDYFSGLLGQISNTASSAAAMSGNFVMLGAIALGVMYLSTRGKR